MAEFPTIPIHNIIANSTFYGRIATINLIAELPTIHFMAEFPTIPIHSRISNNTFYGIIANHTYL